MAAPASPPTGDELPIDVDLIKVLASDSRRDILRLLGERRRTLTELADALGLKKATVLEHLQKLVLANLIRKIDDGERLWIYYELTPRGVRLVRPGRTRFYLIMAGSAAALILVGAIVAASMMGGLPKATSQDMSAQSPQALSDAVRATTPLVVWRGFDDGIAIPIDGPAPAGSTLVIEGGGTLPISDGRATLGGQAIDALSEGRHALRLHSEAGEIPLDASLDVRTPPVALAPLAIPEDEATMLVASIGAPGLPTPTDIAAYLDGQPIPLSELGRERTLSVTPTSTGDITVQLGRLNTFSVRALPDMRLDASDDNGTLVLNVSNAVGPLAGVVASLDGALLPGATDANGTLRAAWPEPGEHALSLTATSGQEQQIALSTDQHGVAFSMPRLTISAFADPVATGLAAQVEVRNDGLVPEVVTLVARTQGTSIASARVDVPAHGSAQAKLAATLTLREPVTIDAFGARSPVVFMLDARGDGSAFDSNDNATVSASQPAPAAPQEGALSESQRAPTPAAAPPMMGASSIFAYGRAPDATTTIFPVMMTNEAAAARDAGAPQAPAVPGPSAALLLAAVAIAALVLARRRS